MLEEKDVKDHLDPDPVEVERAKENMRICEKFNTKGPKQPQNLLHIMKGLLGT